MRWPIRAATLLSMLLLAAPSSGASNQDWDDCRQPGDRDNRVTACTRVIENAAMSPHNRAVAYNVRGNAWRSQGNYDRAIVDYGEAIRLDPTLAFAYSNRGIAWHNKVEYDRAIADYSEAIRLNPKLAIAYSDRGLARLDKRDNPGAMADCNQAIDVAPKMAAGYNCRGLAFRAVGDNDRALADCDQAIKIAPKYAAAYNCRGLIWASKGDYERAIADYTEAIKIAPKFFRAFNNRGRAWANKNDYDRAIADYTEAIGINPKYRVAYHNRGTAWSLKGDNSHAVADYTEAIRLSPKKPSDATQLNAPARTGGPPATAAASINAATPATAAVPATLPNPLPHAATTGTGRRVALVIGNSAYTAVAALTNPERDASTVAAALRKVGFATVMVKNNATRQDLVAALKRFEDEAEKSDWAVVYYAGHGIELGGINYLIPVDAKLKEDRDIQDEAIPLERVLSSVESARKLRLVILDACRDNPFVGQMHRSTSTRSISRGLGSIEPEGGVLVAYAAKHGHTALDGSGVNSPFASALVSRLSTPNLEISMLFRMVRDDVLSATAKQQEPFVYGSLPGEALYFVQR